MAEIAFASGITAALVDPIITFGWYEKKPTAAECIKEYQYIQRFVGYYADRGVTIATDIDGMNANVQFPMSVDIAGVIVVAILAAEQGVKSVIPRISMYGHMAQDIAWARVLRKLIREYLDKFGYKMLSYQVFFWIKFPYSLIRRTWECLLVFLVTVRWSGHWQKEKQFM